MSIWIPGGLSDSGSSSYIPPSWSTGSDEEIVEALEKHYAGEIDLTEYWSVGDERTVSLSLVHGYGAYIETIDKQDVVFVLTEVGGKTLADGVTECLFQVDQKDCLIRTGAMYSSASNTYGWARNNIRRTWCNNYYINSIPASLITIFKPFINQTTMGNKKYILENSTDTFALRAQSEISGQGYDEGAQIEWYKTSTNRLKKVKDCGYTDDIYYWWLRSPMGNTTDYFKVTPQGNGDYSSATYTFGIAPFGVI